MMSVAVVERNLSIIPVDLFVCHPLLAPSLLHGREP